MKFRRKYTVLLAAIVTSLVFLFGLAQADDVDNRIYQLNQKLQAGELPWTAGRTSVSDLSPEERKNLLGGPSEPLELEPTAGESLPSDYSGGASASWDWRNVGGTNWMTPVTDQMCGDCWAHATCGSMEVRLRWQRGGTYGYELPINLSERYAVTCSPHGSCSSWNIPGLLNYIQSDGIPDEDCLPYDPALDCTDRCSNWSHRVYKVTNHGTYTDFSSNGDVMNSCEYSGPIAVWMMVYDDLWDYNGGIYIRTSSVEEGGHFVNIVGWGTSGSTPYWICKNSWGEDWGVNGYFYIRRGTNESRIEEQAYWLTPQNLPNLDDSTPTGWDYPIVPRGDATATAGSCHVSPTLPGNSAGTYWNVNWINEGSVEARDNVTHLSVDDIYTNWFSISYQPAGYETKHINYNSQTIKGGRHTICQNIDLDNRVWEYDESDNTYCRQFVWSPKALYNNVPQARSAPPKKDTLGYSSYNCDGFSFLVQQDHPDDWWSAVGVLPFSSGADYDVRLHDIGTYTGSEGGFGSYLEYSSYSGSVSDFVIVNNNMTSAGTYYAGILNDNEGTGDFRIEEDTSEKIYDGTNGPYSKTTTNVLDIYEYDISTSGDYGFKLDQTSGTCDLGMSLYDDETVTASKSEYMTGGYANSAGDGGDEYMRVTIPDPGFHGLVVWKADSSDYAKSAGYNIKVGPCATPGALANPSPADVATNVSVEADLDWDDCADTEYYEVWLREGFDSWVKQGDTETSAWTLPTLNEATHYDWFVRAWNICGTSISIYWDFITEDNTPPAPNPMTWATEPYETSTSSISMVATTATDPSGPVEYYFFTYGGTPSAWQTSTTYTDSGLSANTQYSYWVRARDNAQNPNYTVWTPQTYEYTDIETPTGITFGAVTITSIQARSTNTPSGLTLGSSGLYISNDTAGTVSGWKQDNNYWTSGSLHPNTEYSFRAIARNGDANNTRWCPTENRYTLANQPAAAAFSHVTQTSIRANWTANGNPAGTQYYCQNTTAGTGSGWTTNTSWNSAGLSPDTTYSFHVRARNADGEVTDWTSLGSEHTLPAGDPCEGNFDGDTDVDGNDLAVFAADFGRTDCP